MDRSPKEMLNFLQQHDIKVSTITKLTGFSVAYISGMLHERVDSEEARRAFLEALHEWIYNLIESANEFFEV